MARYKLCHWCGREYAWTSRPRPPRAIGAERAALLENGGHDACGEVCDEDVPSV